MFSSKLYTYVFKHKLYSRYIVFIEYPSNPLNSSVVKLVNCRETHRLAYLSYEVFGGLGSLGIVLELSRRPLTCDWR